jgi:hypothetical protein
VKGCAIFAALFLLGIGVMVSGVVHDALYAGAFFQDQVPGMQRHDDRPNNVARVLEVAGLALSFGAIFGMAGWRFYLRQRGPDAD